VERERCGAKKKREGEGKRRREEKERETDAPGPPLGPRYLNTITVFSSFLISPAVIAAATSSSLSNTLAFPLNVRPSLPVILLTHPPGAMLPFKMRR
jgi:hypothetical protein